MSLAIGYVFGLTVASSGVTGLFLSTVGAAVLLVPPSRREELFTAHARDVFGHCSGFLEVVL
jgi:hypothetical protein